MRGTGLVSSLTVILLLIGYLAVIAQCRLEAGRRRSYQEDRHTGATTVNATSLDESKLNLRFCTGHVCRHPPRPCYCCELLPPDQPCFDSRDECWQKCPACDPKCPGPPATELHA
ncbi:hypothetical protein ACQJBY_072393 [Aegilops geniculata]